MRILVVDDHEFTRSITVRLLGELGVTEITEAQDGAAALEAARAARPDIVVSDLNMPGMDGMMFIRHLAKDRLAESLIVLSGLGPNVLSAVESLAVASGLRVLGAVRKPLRKEALAALLHLHANPSAAGPGAEVDLAAVERAIALGEISAWYGPLFDVPLGGMAAVVVHPRWDSKQHALRFGNEEFGSIDGAGPALFRYMARSALSACSQWTQSGWRGSFLVPMGTGALADDAALDWMQSQLHINQLAGNAIGISVDGAAFAADPVSAAFGVARALMHAFVVNVVVRSAADLDATRSVTACSIVTCPAGWMQAEPALYRKAIEFSQRAGARFAVVDVPDATSLGDLATSGAHLAAGNTLGAAAPAGELFNRHLAGGR